MNPEHLLSVRICPASNLINGDMTLSSMELDLRKSAGSIFLNLNEKDYYYDPASKKKRQLPF
jgi:hypothetical protein